MTFLHSPRVTNESSIATFSAAMALLTPAPFGIRFHPRNTGVFPLISTIRMPNQLNLVSTQRQPDRLLDGFGHLVLLVAVEGCSSRLASRDASTATPLDLSKRPRSNIAFKELAK